MPFCLPTRPVCAYFIGALLASLAWSQVGLAGADDHEDTPPGTSIEADNAQSPGSINGAGDVDVFLVSNIDLDQDLVVRLTGLAGGFEPMAEVSWPDGTVVGAGSSALAANLSTTGYFLIRVPAVLLDGTGEVFVHVSHLDSDAVQGSYFLSAGPATAADEFEQLFAAGFETADAPAIELSFDPPNQQISGTTVDVHWQIQGEVTTCFPEDSAYIPTNWEQLGPITSSSGSRSVPLGSVDLTFALGCVGAGGTDYKSITAYVQSSDGGPKSDNFVISPECQGLQPPLTVWGRVDAWNGAVINVNADRFYDLFDSQYGCSLANEANCIWPGVQGTKVQTVIRRSEYAALKFVASEPAMDSGSIVFEDGSFGGSAPRVISIAPCPGQFTDLPIGCSQAVLAGRLRWRNSNANFAECELTPGETYYLNMINAEAGNLSAPSCPTSSCSNIIEAGG